MALLGPTLLRIEADPIIPLLPRMMGKNQGVSAHLPDAIRARHHGPRPNSLQHPSTPFLLHDTSYFAVSLFSFLSEIVKARKHS
ncbi:hypothetical protein RJT34_30936 [Clitoria ternatea]|uniref:Uncharacterized protein n=1 Tax=Clitoria ternatea TaxID=43366 RepID=A0AAN9I0W4_CLITE